MTDGIRGVFVENVENSAEPHQAPQSELSPANDDAPSPTPESVGVAGEEQVPGAGAASVTPEPASIADVDPFAAIRSGDREKIAVALWQMFSPVLKRHPAISKYFVVVIFDPHTSIGTYELDRIYRSLKARNRTRENDVLLLLMSSGGKIEPAYQISKICKKFSNSKFVVCVPRYAKSAATLIALGADQIHMGMLGELGPIDPQFQGLPALAVARALETLAELAEKHPKSSDMLAQYLKDK
jgi:hypothetical protein